MTIRQRLKQSTIYTEKHAMGNSELLDKASDYEHSRAVEVDYFKAFLEVIRDFLQERRVGIDHVVISEELYESIMADLEQLSRPLYEALRASKEKVILAYKVVIKDGRSGIIEVIPAQLDCSQISFIRAVW